MEVVITSLDALIHRATNASLDRPDPAALEAFCSVLADSPNGAYVATRVIASRLRSPHPAEALLTLDVLDACMKRCEPAFRAEVDKFRFLNEMIKLVSPKYYGNKTAPAVRQKVLNLMHGWTVEYPREVKIRDAYEMLKKQGVVKDIPPPQLPPPQVDVPPAVPRQRNKEGIYEDEERSRMLQKLLQSKNPDDLQAANRLIKTMVREDERRVEAVSRRMTELQTVHNNARLLDEMLDQYKPGVSSVEDLELIKELHAACNRLRPTVFKLAAETQQNEETLSEVLEASDELGQVFEKYTAIILHGKSLESVQNVVKTGCQPGSILLNGEGNSLLDLASPMPSHQQVMSSLTGSSETSGGAHSMEELGDIFSSVPLVKDGSEMNAAPILKPVSVISKIEEKVDASSKLPAPLLSRGLADLDALGAGLLKDSLPPSFKSGGQFNNKQLDRVPMNLLGKIPPRDNFLQEITLKSPTERESQQTAHNFLDLDYLISKTLNSEGKSNISNSTNDDLMVDISSDDSLLGLKSKSQEEDPEISLLEYLNELKTSADTALSEQSQKNNEKTVKKPDSVVPSYEVEKQEKIFTSKNKEETANVSKEEDVANKIETKHTPSKTSEVMPLTDINIGLDCITPGEKPPLTAFEEEDGITVVLHFTTNKPRPDVSVIVVSTTSRNLQPIQDFKFNAVVPKGCKVRLLPPSGDSFPAFSPFLPPAAVTQVMLVARPPVTSPQRVFLKFVITYMCQDDMISEIGEVNNMPLDGL